MREGIAEQKSGGYMHANIRTSSYQSSACHYSPPPPTVIRISGWESKEVVFVFAAVAMTNGQHFPSTFVGSLGKAGEREWGQSCKLLVRPIE